jgi:hypothetical protein
MPEEPNVIPPSRLARWLLLLLLIAGGVALYFRNGTRLAPFGSAGPSTQADTAN